MAKAVLFDFDGVAVDTEHLYIQIQQDSLKHFNLPALTPKEITEEYGSIGFFRRTLQRRGVSEQVTIQINEYRKRLSDSKLSNLPPRPDFIKLFNSVKATKFPVGLVSSSRLSWISRLLGDRAKILEDFDALVTFEDVDEHKPSPKPYLLAASKLLLPPQQCVAIEDSLLGICSAKSAGCKVIALKSPEFPQDTTIADKVVESLDELDSKMLKEF